MRFQTLVSDFIQEREKFKDKRCGIKLAAFAVYETHFPSTDVVEYTVNLISQTMKKVAVYLSYYYCFLLWASP